MRVERVSSSAAETHAAGAAFADLLRPGDIVLLEGPLGAGKTTFTQGVAAGLGVSERVTSPTFTVVRQHTCHNQRGIRTLHHADVYRVENLSEVEDLSLGELVEESAVVLVEWGEIAETVLGTGALRVRFAVTGDDDRRLDVSADGRDTDLAAWAS